LQADLAGQRFRLHGVGLAHADAAGMLREDAVPQHVRQHAFGAIGRDVGEPLVVILLELEAQIAHMIEKIPREQPDADAEFQNEIVSPRPRLACSPLPRYSGGEGLGVRGCCQQVFRFSRIWKIAPFGLA
jgi:hypothetical protein